MYFIDKILDPTLRGWIKVLKQNSKEVFICYGTRAELLETKIFYQVILIKEGIYKGQEVRIPYKRRSNSYKISYLSELTKPQGPAELFLDITKSILYSPHLGKFKVVIKNDIQYGLYYLQLPDYPHSNRIGNEYLDEKRGGSRFSETWFKIIPRNNEESEIYLHFGKYSEGCITVLYDSKSKVQMWNKIYLYLMSLRLDSTNVGILKVI